MKRKQVMNTDTKTIIREHFNELPDVVQDVILNSKWELKIRNIVTNNKLHIDQGAAIENLVFVTMLGMETPDDFIENAKEYANLSEEQAYAISVEVEREIFGQIRRKLVEITETADTVDDIGRVTDELGKVAGDIETRAKLETEQGYEAVKKSQLGDNTLVLNGNNGATLDISGGKRERKSLKDTIPVNYFDKNKGSEASQTTDSPSIQKLRHEDSQSQQTKDVAEDTTPIPVRKADPYREPVAKEEPTQTTTITKAPEHELTTIPKAKQPITPIALDDEDIDETPVHKIETIETQEEVTPQNSTPVVTGDELLSQNIPNTETKKGGLFGIFKKKASAEDQITKPANISAVVTEPLEPAAPSIVEAGLNKPLISKKEKVILGEVKKEFPKPDFVEKPSTQYNTPTDPYREPVE